MTKVFNKKQTKEIKFPLVCSAKHLYDNYLKDGYSNYSRVIEYLDNKVNKGTLCMEKIEDGRSHRCLGYVISEFELQNLKQNVGLGIPKEEVFEYYEIGTLLKKYTTEPFSISALCHLIKAFECLNYIELPKIPLSSKLYINEEHKINLIETFKKINKDKLYFYYKNLSKKEEIPHLTPNEQLKLNEILENSSSNVHISTLQRCMNWEFDKAFSYNAVYNGYQNYLSEKISIWDFVKEIPHKSKVLRDFKMYLFQKLPNEKNLKWERNDCTNRKLYSRNDLYKVYLKEFPYKDFLSKFTSSDDISFIQNFKKLSVENWDSNDLLDYVKRNISSDDLEASCFTLDTIFFLIYLDNPAVTMYPKIKSILYNLNDSNNKVSFNYKAYNYSFNQKGNLIWSTEGYTTLESFLQKIKHKIKDNKMVKKVLENMCQNNEIVVYPEKYYSFKNYVSNCLIEKIEQSLPSYLTDASLKTSPKDQNCNHKQIDEKIIKKQIDIKNLKTQDMNNQAIETLTKQIENLTKQTEDLTKIVMENKEKELIEVPVYIENTFLKKLSYSLKKFFYKIKPKANADEYPEETKF